jgi:membrane fusion protein (multidrug efflux system)
LYAVTDGLGENEKILVEGLRKVKNNDHVSYNIQTQKQILAELNDLHAE